MGLKRLVLAGLVAAVAAAPWAAPNAEAEAKNTATYAMYGDVKDWDPSIAFSLEVMMLVNVYEPLLWYNPPGSDTQFTPALATEWSVSDDGLAWTFKLREGVTFHDGEPFNAAAAKAALDRTISMKKGAWYIWASVDSIEAPDDTTLVIKTKGPQPIDLIASSQYGAYIFSPKAAEQGTDWFNEGNAAGTGPYQVRQWVKGQQIVLEKFDGYWGGWSDKNFDRVILKPVTENATQVQMLKAGEADFISLVPADLVASLNQEEGIKSYAIPSWKNSMYLINTQRYPTDNLKVRQALTHLWDYDTVVKDIYAGHAEVARGVVPATMWGHNDGIQAPKFDPALARKLLEESGIPEDDWKVSMAYIGTSEEYKNSALLLQENARQVGLEIELMPGEWGVIWDRAKNLETAPNLQSMTWWPTYPTPNDWMIGLYRTEDPALFNLSHYSNPEYDKILDSGVAMEGPDRAKAIEAYHQAQQILMEDAVAIFYADIKTRVARRANIEGLEVNPAYNAVFFHRIHRK